MEFILIIVMPPILVLASVAVVFVWGAVGKEHIENMNHKLSEDKDI